MKKVYYRRHFSSDSHVRAWCEEWASDVFCILDRASFDAMRELTRGAVEFVDADEEDDS